MVPLQRLFSLTIVFFLRVRSRTLCAQWTCYVFSGLACLVLPFPVSRVMHHQFVYSFVPFSVSRVFLPVQMWIDDSSPVTCSFPVSLLSLLTRTLTFLTYVFLLLARRLVLMLTFTAYAFLFQFVDSSPVSVFLDSDSSLTHFPFTNICTCISQDHYIYGLEMGLLPIFNLLCNHPKGVTCEIPRTLLVLSSSLAKATALRFLGVISSVPSLTGSEVQPTQCTSVRS